jgi:hypothetical protein
VLARRHGITRAKNTHRYGDGENKGRYKKHQIVAADLNVVLTNAIQPAGQECYFHMCNGGIEYGVQNQRSDDIAIEDENYFWQPPSEP